MFFFLFHRQLTRSRNVLKDVRTVNCHETSSFPANLDIIQGNPLRYRELYTGGPEMLGRGVRNTVPSTPRRSRGTAPLNCNLLRIGQRSSEAAPCPACQRHQNFEKLSTDIPDLITDPCWRLPRYMIYCSHEAPNCTVSPINHIVLRNECPLKMIGNNCFSLIDSRCNLKRLPCPVCE